jgi:DNA polymerase-3 subunit delta'
MSFADFAGQQRVVQLLQRSLKCGRLAHAYLFTGSQLSELETMAGTLAKTLNCKQPIRAGAAGMPVDSCDRCLSCRKIAEYNHPDVQWVRPESKSRIITIDQIRDLMRVIHLKPTEAEYKVGVIVAADRLNPQAANAFLKTLEEPPAKSVLILISSDPQRLLETILSRCLRLNFAGEADAQVKVAEQTWLTSFAETAGKGAKGMLGRYRLLSALLKRLGEIKAQIETALTAKSPLEKYADIEPKLREKWEDELTASVEAEYRRQRSELLIGFQYWLRDVWLHTMRLPDELLTFPMLRTDSAAVAERISPKEATENLRVMEETNRLLGSNVQEALAIEVGLLKLKL